MQVGGLARTAGSDEGVGAAIVLKHGSVHEEASDGRALLGKLAKKGELGQVGVREVGLTGNLSLGLNEFRGYAEAEVRNGRRRRHKVVTKEARIVNAVHVNEDVRKRQLHRLQTIQEVGI